MSGFNYANLVTDIRNYTEVGDSVLTAAIINRFIEDAEFKIFYDVPIDAYRYVSEGTLVTDDNTILIAETGSNIDITKKHEILTTEANAILDASADLISENIPAYPEIMIPLVGSVEEFKNQQNIIKQCASKIENNRKIKLNYKIGTMIELPRACLIADQIAKHADFFSFGTNDLTQTTFGFSRDDVSGLLNDYMKNDILSKDPFQSIDIEGVGELVKTAVIKAKSVNPNIKIGICGEHGGDPSSIKFFYELGLDYVSCSPFRVPISILTTSKFI